MSKELNWQRKTQPHLTEKHIKKRRLAFAREHKHWPVDQSRSDVMFMDDSLHSKTAANELWRAEIIIDDVKSHFHHRSRSWLRLMTLQRDVIEIFVNICHTSLLHTD